MTLQGYFKVPHNNIICKGIIAYRYGKHIMDYLKLFYNLQLQLNITCIMSIAAVNIHRDIVFLCFPLKGRIPGIPPQALKPKLN